MKETAINFSLGYDRADFDDRSQRWRAAQIRPQPMVGTDMISVDEVPAMFEALRKPGSRAKVLVEFPCISFSSSATNGKQKASVRACRPCRPRAHRFGSEAVFKEIAEAFRCPY